MIPSSVEIKGATFASFVSNVLAFEGFDPHVHNQDMVGALVTHAGVQMSILVFHNENIGAIQFIGECDSGITKRNTAKLLQAANLANHYSNVQGCFYLDQSSKHIGFRHQIGIVSDEEEFDVACIMSGVHLVGHYLSWFYTVCALVRQGENLEDVCFAKNPLTSLGGSVKH